MVNIIITTTLVSPICPKQMQMHNFKNLLKNTCKFLASEKKKYKTSNFYAHHCANKNQ